MENTRFNFFCGAAAQ